MIVLQMNYGAVLFVFILLRYTFSNMTSSGRGRSSLRTRVRTVFGGVGVANLKVTIIGKSSVICIRS